MLVNFYLNKTVNDTSILKKLCSKYLYTKFLILTDSLNLKYTSPFFLDNYFSEFTFNVKKKKIVYGFSFKVKKKKKSFRVFI